MSIKKVLWPLGLLLFFSSCEDINNSTKEEENEIKLQFVTTEVHLPIESKEEISLNVDPVKKANQVEFTSTDEKVVGIVNSEIGEDGVTLTLEGLSLGTSTIVAVLEDKMVECVVSVVPIEVEKLFLDKSELDLNVNDTYTFKVSVEPSNATSPVVEWSSSDEQVAVINRGTVTGLAEGSTVITASIGDIKAQCTVNVHEVKGESLNLDVHSKEITEGETFIVTATVLPENVTVRSMRWSVIEGEGVIGYEVIDAKEDDNVTAAKVTGLKEGNAVLSVECAGMKAKCDIVVKAKVKPVEDVKLGDYYYSDGTWSDGGFLGYESDGLTIKWANPKPSPEEGKTVIGIVFQTDKTRISDTEKAAGYNHGLVMAIRSAHGKDPLTKYSIDYNFENIPNITKGADWYADISGYQWTQEILKAYPGDKILNCPAFDFTTTDFNPSAPEGTSGWYVPSIGQLWDMLAAFGGGEVAAHLKKMRDYASDITYYWQNETLSLTYNPIEKLNSVMSKVPADKKEEFVISGSRGSSKLCEIMSSSLYNNSEGNVCVFWLYDTGEIEFETDWTNQSYVCRPILSF